MSTNAPASRIGRIERRTGIPFVTRALFLLLLCSSVPTLTAGVAMLSCQKTPAATPNNKARLLFFTALWCAPCHRIQPVVEKICLQNRSVLELVIIDYDEYPATVEDFGVESLPTLILLDRFGKLRIKVNGASKEGMDALFAEIKGLTKSAK